MTTQKTYFATAKDADQQWYLVDAAGQSMGRLATNIARVLRGKHRPQYTPHINSGAHVVVVNADKIAFTGAKGLGGKVYRRYTGYPGGLRERTVAESMAVDPTFPLRHAIRGMLQHNTLGRDMLTRVRIYAGATHPHEAQQPVAVTFGPLGEIVRGTSD